MNKNEVEECTILKIISGSHAYGFATADSDVDTRGICIPSSKWFLSYENRFDQLNTQENGII